MIARYVKRKVQKYVKRRLTRRRRPLRYISPNKPVMFSNSVSVLFTGNATGTSGTGYARTFAFDDINDKTDIMSLYDFYRIQSIEIQFIPAWNVAGNSTSQASPMYYCIDPTSGTAPTANTELLNFSRVKVASVAKPFKLKFVPSMFQSVGVLSSNEYQTVKTNRLWLTNTDTICYGFRVWVDPLYVNSAPIGTFIYTYNVLAKFQS